MDNKAIYGKKEIEFNLTSKLLKKLLIHEIVYISMKHINKIDNLAKEYGCEIIIIPDLNDHSQQFLQMYGGIGGITFY